MINLHGVAVLEIEPLVHDPDQLVCLFLVREEGRLEFVASIPGKVCGLRYGKPDLGLLNV